MRDRVVAPYGTWSSPIDAALVARAATYLSEARLDGGSAWWLELRAGEGGRTVAVRRDPLADPVDVTPPGFDVRTLVHEYGGGAFTVRDGISWFANYGDQRLYRQEPGGEPTAVTPEPPAARSLRYADMDVSADGRWIVCVRERHGHDASLPVNEVVAIRADGSREPQVLATGADFYAAPRLSPAGDQVAWIAWDMPWMPWDRTRLVVASFADGRVTAAVDVAGEDAESVIQPVWSPPGDLHFLSDRTGWWNLYRLEPEGRTTALAPADAEFGVPAWEFGYSSYAFLQDGRIACAYRSGGVHHLAILDAATGELIDVDVPYTCFDPPYLRTEGDRVVFLGSSATSTHEVVVLDLGSREVDVVREAQDPPLGPDLVSVADPVEFPTDGGRHAFAYYYPPTSDRFVGPGGEAPPLVVHAHGGPTSEATPDLKLWIQFFTTRGFAVADVNYGGSTGNGREFRERLYGNWGVVDVRDCIAAARFLARTGRADPDRLVVTGGSAGGYVVLASLAFHPDAFAAGTSYYGVSDLEPFATFTHKFELKYTDLLVGRWPEAADRWRERSPVGRAASIRRPVLLLQGLEDAVVPPSQAEIMIAALDENRTPYAYVAFEGEQHGFRKAESIARALQAELAFYGAVLGLDLADDLPDLRIHHLPPDGAPPG